QEVLLPVWFDHNNLRSKRPGEVLVKTNIRDMLTVERHSTTPEPGMGRRSVPFFADGGRLANYGLAVVLVASALPLARSLEANFVGAPVSLMLCAVMLSGWFGGLGAGLLASALAFLAFSYEFVAPIQSLSINPAQIPRLLAFGVSAFLIGLLSGGQRRITESLRRARDELGDTYRELKISNEALHVENAMRGRAESALRDSEQRFRDFAGSGS